MRDRLQQFNIIADDGMIYLSQFTGMEKSSHQFIKTVRSPCANKTTGSILVLGEFASFYHFNKNYRKHTIASKLETDYQKSGLCHYPTSSSTVISHGKNREVISVNSAIAHKNSLTLSSISFFISSTSAKKVNTKFSVPVV